MAEGPRASVSLEELVFMLPLIMETTSEARNEAPSFSDSLSRDFGLTHEVI